MSTTAITTLTKPTHSAFDPEQTKKPPVYAYVPYSSLESVIELNKEAYYLALRQTQGTIRTETPNWQPWLVFFLRSLAEQVRHLEQYGSGRGVWYGLK